MAESDFYALAALALMVALSAYKIGALVGGSRTYRELEPALERGARYRLAVDDLDRWCGHGSPHARLIAAHLKAHGEGLGPINAGTPCDDEPCTVSGLRDQLRRLDAKPARTDGGDGGEVKE